MRLYATVRTTLPIAARASISRSASGPSANTCVVPISGRITSCATNSSKRAFSRWRPPVPAQVATNVGADDVNVAQQDPVERNAWYGAAGEAHHHPATISGQRAHRVEHPVAGDRVPDDVYTTAGGMLQRLILPRAVRAEDHVRAGLERGALLGIRGHDAEDAAGAGSGNLDGGGAGSASRAVDQDRLARLEAAADLQAKDGRRVVQRQAAPSANDIDSGKRIASPGCMTAHSAAAAAHVPARRSPGRKPLSGGAEITTPAGFASQRVRRRCLLLVETFAAQDVGKTEADGVHAQDDPVASDGSGTSTRRTPSGPVSCVTWSARIDGQR